jgi:hypothetical protein
LFGKTHSEARLTRYLLGEGSPGERERLEVEYFADEKAFARMLSAEDDLIDAYARGQLSADQRRQFEKKFLNSNEGRERVQFARMLAGAESDPPVNEVPAPTPGFLASLLAGGVALRFAAVAVVIVLVGSEAWLLVDRTRTQNELNALRVENEKLQRVAAAERARSEQLALQVNPAAQASPPPPAEIIDHRKPRERVVNTADAKIGRPKDGTQGATNVANLLTLEPDVVVLRSGNVRSVNGGSGNTVAVSSKATFIKMRVVVDGESSYPKYRATITKPEGDPVWNSGSFTPQANTDGVEGIALTPVPAKDLRPGDYILSLEGEQADGSTEPVAKYSFRVVKKPAKH